MKQIFTILLTCFLTSSLFAQSQAFWTTYNDQNSGLSGNNVYAVAIDAQGNKWFATSYGVSKFDGTNWTTYNTWNSGLCNDNVQSVVIDAQGNKWFGTSYGGVSKFNGTTWTTYNTANSGLSSDEITSIAIDAQGNKWFGTYWGGVSKFDGTNWTTYNTTNSGLSDDIVMAIAIDAQGNKWFGCDAFGVSKFDGTNWTTYNQLNSGLCDNNVRSIAIDAQGNKWVGTALRGVSKFDGTNWTTYDSTNSGLNDSAILSIFIDAQGNKWFSTYLGGLSKFDGTNWTTYTTTNSGLCYDYVHSIGIDGQGDKWVCTFWGVSQLSEIDPYNGARGNFSMANSCGITLDTTNCLTAQYSTISGITSGNTYTFESSVGTDYIIITNDDNYNGILYDSGTSPLVWNATVSGTIRFYTYLDSLYNYDDSAPRTRSITSNKPLAIVTPAGSTTFCTGGSVVLNAATGTNYSYQWMMNGTNIVGGTSNSYTASLLGAYQVVVSLGTCKDTSTVTNINSLINASLTSTPNNGTNNGTATAAVSGGTPPYQYAWSNGQTTNPATGLSTGSYGITITDSLGCTYQSTVSVSSNVGIGNSLADIQLFDIFPNPTDIGIFNLSILSTQSNDYTITIYNNLGQKVATQTFSDTQSIREKFDISKFVKGVYLVELSTNKGKTAKKLMIE